MTDDGRRVETLAIMMTDVEGSTALRMERGDVVADEILGTHAQILRDQLRSHGGQERQFLGDGFLLSFRSPLDAVRCAIGIQRALEEHNAADPEHRIRVRIGIHVGEVSERAGELYGQALHAAARVMAEAAGGQVLVSAAVRDAVHPGGHVAIRRLGAVLAQGIPRAVAALRGGVGRGVDRPVDDRGAAADGARRARRRAGEPAPGGRRGTGRPRSPGAGGGRGRRRQVPPGRRGRARGRGARDAGSDRPLRGVGGRRAVPALRRDDRAGGQRSAQPQVLQNALAGVAPEIARIAPALRRLLPDIGPPVELPPELAQRYVWNSVGEFLTRGAQGFPLLLFLEDLHWADESTVLLTEYLAPLLPDLPALVLGTYRDGEVDVSHPLSRVISVLARRRLVERIGLEGLSPSGVRAMVEALAGQPAPDRLVRLIEMETEGNPFFIEDVYFHLAESGALRRTRAGAPGPLVGRELRTQGVRLVLGKRLARLSPTTRDALTAAAILGRVFSPDLVGEVAGADPDALIDAFDEAEHARLIAPAARDGHLAFSHELIRQTLLADASTLKRERLHLRAADTIERSYPDDIEAHAGDLTHHLSLAGPRADPGRFARYLAIAGRRAFDAAAFEDAVVQFQKALALVAPGDQEARAELLERLALALRSVGRWDDSLRTMNEALDLYQELGSTEGIGRLRGRWSTS